MTFQQSNQDFSAELLAAADMGYSKRVQDVLERFQNSDCSNERGESAIWKACKRGHLEILELLLRAGADVNQASKDGSTPLLVAAQHGQLVMLRRLMEVGAGADLNKATFRGHTPPLGS